MPEAADQLIDDIVGETEAEEEALAITDAEEAEAQATGEGEIEEEGGKSKTVPHEALHEERERRKESDKKLDEMATKVTRMEALQERGRQERAEAERAAALESGAAGIPDYEEDPVGHLLATISIHQEKLDGLTMADGQRNEREAAAGQEHHLLELYANSVRSFSEDNADFNDAYTFLAKSVDKELQARGITDPGERENALQYEEGQLVGRALNGGKNPAELIYNLAVHRGYAKLSGTDGDGAGSTGEDRIDTLTEGARKATTLSGGGKTDPPVTLARLAAMPDDDPEFDKLWDKARAQGLL